MGQSPDSDDCNTDEIGIPFLQGNAEFGQLNPMPKYWCEVARKFALPNDILLSVRAPVGQINIAEQKYGIGRGICAIAPRSSMDRRYLWFLLQIIREELTSVSAESTYDAVTVDDVKGMIGVIPPSHEQHAIVNCLDRKTSNLDSLISKIREYIARLQEYRTALISAAVTGKIDVHGSN